VELNLAAMLDMAFQLLTFFIVTFKPGQVEGQINLRLPPPVPITTTGTDPVGSQISKTDVPMGLETITISVFSAENGSIKSLAVGTTPVGNLDMLNEKLREVFSDGSLGFQQVLIQAGGRLRYDELMKVVEVCTHQKLPGGEPLSKLSFVEVPEELKEP
jgi:biopolymer transport protein ExbD